MKMATAANKNILVRDFPLSSFLFVNISRTSPMILVLVICALPTTIAAVQQVTVYPGGDFTRDYTLYNENLTWIEAYYHCSSVGGIFVAYDWPDGLSYIKNAVLTSGWSSSVHIWIGIMKYGQDDRWIRSSNCYSVVQSEINGAMNGELQCVLLNMTSENHEDKLFYAASCGTRAAHICAFSTGRFADATDVYTIYNQMTVHDSVFFILNVSSQADCVTQTFISYYFCYGSEYLITTQKCFLFRRSPTSLPDIVNITQSSDDRNLILKKTNRVFIDDGTTGTDVMSMTDLEYPCPEPPIPTTSIKTTTEPSISNSTETPISTTTGTSVLTTAISAKPPITASTAISMPISDSSVLTTESSSSLTFLSMTTVISVSKTTESSVLTTHEMSMWTTSEPSVSTMTETTIPTAFTSALKTSMLEESMMPMIMTTDTSVPPASYYSLSTPTETSIMATTGTTMLVINDTSITKSSEPSVSMVTEPQMPTSFSSVFKTSMLEENVIPMPMTTDTLEPTTSYYSLSTPTEASIMATSGTSKLVTNDTSITKSTELLRMSVVENSLVDTIQSSVQISTDASIQTFSETPIPVTSKMSVPTTAELPVSTTGISFQIPTETQNPTTIDKSVPKTITVLIIPTTGTALPITADTTEALLPTTTNTSELKTTETSIPATTGVISMPNTIQTNVPTTTATQTISVKMWSTTETFMISTFGTSILSTIDSTVPPANKMTNSGTTETSLASGLSLTEASMPTTITTSVATTPNIYIPTNTETSISTTLETSLPTQSDILIPTAVEASMLVSSPPSGLCICNCTMNNITEQEILSKMEAIKKALAVDKKSLSNQIRKKTCAADDRTSARAVGYLGVIMLNVVFLLIIFNDLLSFIRFIYDVK